MTNDTNAAAPAAPQGANPQTDSSRSNVSKAEPPANLEVFKNFARQMIEYSGHVLTPLEQLAFSHWLLSQAAKYNNTCRDAAEKEGA